MSCGRCLQRPASKCAKYWTLPTWLNSARTAVTCLWLRAAWQAEQSQKLRANTDRLDDPVQASKLALRSLATRVRDVDAEIVALDEHLCALFGHVAPAYPRSCRSKSRASQPSVVNAGRKIDCLHSEAALAHLCGVGPATASFGKTRRHRLSCGGDHDERAVNREVRAGTEGAGG